MVLVDTNRCLSKEARDYCKLLANVSAKPGALQRISVSFQNSLAEIIFFKRPKTEPDPEPDVPLGS